MVYLKNYIDDLKQKLYEDNLSTFAYYYIVDPYKLQQLNLDVLEGRPQEHFAAKGYVGAATTANELRTINKPPYQGVGIDSTIYKLMGSYLASKDTFANNVTQKFNATSLKNKYFIALCEPKLTQKLIEALQSNEDEIKPILQIILTGDVNENELVSKLTSYLAKVDDEIDLIILEKLHRVFVERQTAKVAILNKSAKECIIEVLNNFDNAVRKITINRRKGHPPFQIIDEYDVQDLLYVILKSFFPSLTDEDVTPKIGGKTNRIDLSIREEGILIEVKMIKQTDTNEREYVGQLKEDIQSYCLYEWLSHLICFVHDPHHRTRDVQSFYDLNGTQTIREKQFTIDVIVSPTNTRNVSYP